MMQVRARCARRPAAAARIFGVPGRKQRDSDAGFTLLSAVIVVPAAFFLFMLVIQWAILWHATHVANAAAQEALRTAEVYESSAAAGVSDGNAFIAQVAPHLLPAGCVSVDRTAVQVTVRVHCPVKVAVVPVGDYWVDQVVSGPVERFTP